MWYDLKAQWKWTLWWDSSVNSAWMVLIAMQHQLLY